jgi:hypothetical protein
MTPVVTTKLRESRRTTLAVGKCHPPAGAERRTCHATAIEAGHRRLESAEGRVIKTHPAATNGRFPNPVHRPQQQRDRLTSPPPAKTFSVVP